MRVVLVSREVYPLWGGGIGQFIASASRVLREMGEVTILTTSELQNTYEDLRTRRDDRLVEGVRYEFVPEPDAETVGGWYHIMHAYGARLLERLKELYVDDPPDLIEFPDFLGEAYVPLQAALAGDTFFANTRLCVRLHTSAELCEVLDGYVKHDTASRALHAMERFSLRHADRIIWQGGDILGTYHRFYGPAALAPATRIRYPYFGPAVGAEQDRGFSAEGPLRLLYAGRLERRKGVHNLVRALTALDRDDVHLTLHGADTPTGPLGTSVRDQLELAAADDSRITLGDPLERGRLGEAIRAHHAVVIPSLWECWPYAGLEPLNLNRPVLATPVGGLVEMISPGQTGWLSTGTGPIALEDSLERVLSARDELEELVRSGRVARRAQELAPEGEIRRGYEELLASRAPRKRRMVGRGAEKTLPLVSAVVPYYRADEFLEDTVNSLLTQRYPRLEIVIVNDGSFEEADWLLAELAARRPVSVVTQMNQGLGAARNFGIGQAQGRYIFPLDADNLAEPEFVARAVSILEGDPDVAYVTSWSRYIRPDGEDLDGPTVGYQPLGNHAHMLDVDNVAGDAAAVIRRRLFDAGFRYSEELASYEDWHFYRELQRAGHIGAVIPERLLRYRVRPDSMQAEFAQPHRERILAEMDALMQENGMEWTPSSG